MNHPPQDQDYLHQQRQQEALDRRDRVEAVASDLKQAKLPSNTSIAHAIDSIAGSDSLRQATQNMSPAGKKAVESARKTMLSGKDVLMEKNEGNKLQSAVYHGARAAGSVGGTVQDRINPQDLISTHFSGTSDIASQAGRRIMDLGRLLVTSSEFRHLVRDLQDLFQDVVGAALSSSTNDPQGLQRDVYNDPEGTVRDRASQALDQAHKKLEPHVINYSKGETSITETGQNIASDIADTARDAHDRVKDQVLTQERRDYLVDRLRSIVYEIQSHPEFESSLDELVDLSKEFAHRTTSAVGAVSNVTKDAADQHSGDIQKARTATRSLVESFAGGRSLDGLSAALRNFGDDIANDDNLGTFIDDVREFLRRSIREPGYVQDSGYTDEANALINRGREVFTDKYRTHVSNIGREFKALGDAMAADPTTNQFADNLNELVSDLFLDENGRPTVKFDLVRDFARLLPVIAEKLEYLPVPRVEGSDDNVDYSFDNMVLRCTNLLPRHVHFHTDTTITMHPPVPYSDRVVSRREQGDMYIKHRIHLTISTIRADARDITFYYKKKSGVARLSDYGTADVAVPDRGISIHITLVTGDEKARNDKGGNTDRIFRIERAEAEVHELKLWLKGAKHDLLYKVLNPVLTRTAKKQIERALSERLHGLLVRINEQLVVVARQTANAVTDAAQATKETAHNVAHQAKMAVKKVPGQSDMNPRMEEISIEE